MNEKNTGLQSGMISNRSGRTREILLVGAIGIVWKDPSGTKRTGLISDFKQWLKF